MRVGTSLHADLSACYHWASNAKRKRQFQPAGPEVWDLIISNDGVAAPLDALVADKALRERLPSVANTRLRLALRYLISLGGQHAEEIAACEEQEAAYRTDTLRIYRAALLAPLGPVMT